MVNDNDYFNKVIKSKLNPLSYLYMFTILNEIIVFNRRGINEKKFY
jgi:hypothetical protein